MLLEIRHKNEIPLGNSDQGKYKMSHKSNYLVSVLMPFYNGKKYVEEAIISVLSQTYKNIELLVINDSPENKEDSFFLLELQKKYNFSLLSHKYNMGLTKTLITGFESSKGDYICILAQDDLFLPSKIETQSRYFDDNPSHIWVYGNMEFFDVKNNKKTIPDVDEVLSKIKDRTMIPDLYNGNNYPLYLQGSMAKRDVVEQDIVPLWSKFADDVWPVNIRLFEKFPEQIGLIEEPVTVYRLHGNNTVDNKYRMFSLIIPTITEMCPKHIQRELIANHLYLVDIDSNYLINGKKVFKLKKVLRFLIKISCLFIPSKKYRTQLRRFYRE
jgi:alpha-1,3-rhamnosyltransferase